jgi:hypothetical protein
MLIHLHSPSAERCFDEGRIRARILGEVATAMYPGAPWPAIESQVANEWIVVRGTSPLTWSEVRREAHAGWQVAKLEREGHMCDDAPVFKAA